MAQGIKGTGTGRKQFSKSKLDFYNEILMVLEIVRLRKQGEEERLLAEQRVQDALESSPSRTMQREVVRLRDRNEWLEAQSRQMALTNRYLKEDLVETRARQDSLIQDIEEVNKLLSKFEHLLMEAGIDTESNRVPVTGKRPVRTDSQSSTL